MRDPYILRPRAYYRDRVDCDDATWRRAWEAYRRALRDARIEAPAFERDVIAALKNIVKK